MVKNGLVLPVHDIEMIKFNFQGENSAYFKNYSFFLYVNAVIHVILTYQIRYIVFNLMII